MHRQLALQLSFKLKQEYYEMYGFISESMSLVIVRYNTLILRVTQDKGARISQRLELR